MAQVSIIVPVNNAGIYIKKSLQSLQDQTFSDIRIICIENGSTDNSWEEIISLKNDKRIISLKIPEADVSYARNLGLFWALKSSPYVMFCDADDTYHPQMVNTMVEGISEFKSDIACCEISVDYRADYNLQQSDDIYYTLKFNGFSNNITEIINNIDYSLCNKIFRCSLIQRYSLNFPVSCLYEDACFCWKYLSVCDSIFFIKKRMYNYVRHENSIMNKTFSKSKSSIDHIKIADNIYEFLKKNKVFPKYANEFRQFYNAYLALAKYHSDEATMAKIETLDKEFQYKFFS